MTDPVKQSVHGFLAEADVSVGAGGTGLTLRGAFAQSPLQALESALAAVSSHLADDGAYLAIAWDEFPDMVVSVIANEGASEAAALLGVLRRFREQYPERIRWLLTGSVGLHHALRQLSSSGEQFVTDLQSVPLGPLPPEWAQWLAGSLLLGAGCRFNAATMAALAHATDGIPYLLHLLAAWARDHGPRDLTADHVGVLFTSAIGDLDASHQSTHLLSRLGDHYGDGTPLAEAVLDRLARAPMPRDELIADLPAGSDGDRVRWLLDLLERDHYVTTHGEVRAWRYDALRRIWMQRRA